MNPERADFHVHYTDDTAKEIISYAARENVKAIALVGRAEVSDNVSRFVDFGEALGVEVVTGVEYLARVNSRSYVDLIALGFDHDQPLIARYFSSKTERRRDMNIQVARKQRAFLEGEGFTFESLEQKEEELLRSLMGGEIVEKAINFCEIVVRNSKNRERFEEVRQENREEWEEYLQKYKKKAGYRDNPLFLEAKFLWYLYFRPGKEGFVPVLIGAQKVIDAVHQTNGVVLYSPEGDYSEEDWEELQKMGIDGIMVWHGGKVELSSDIIKKARKDKLLVLGGSDYHPKKNHWKVGVGRGDMFISLRRLDELKKKLEEKRNDGK